MTFDDLVAPVTDLGSGFEGAIAAWQWLVKGQVRPLLITGLGDVFVEQQGAVYFLDTMRGSFEEVAPSRIVWKERLTNADDVFAWFRPDLVGALLEHGTKLAAGQVYSPTVPPILGGDLNPTNFTPSQWRMHLHVLGHIHRQVKDLPPGTPVKFRVDPLR
jgi:hypothetical protein